MPVSFFPNSFLSTINTSVRCRDRAKELDTDPVKAQYMKDWDVWRQTPREACVRARARALGLHIDPGRSRTHVFIQEVVHSPRQRDVHRKFAVLRAGVFRMRDAMRGIEAIFQLAEGHGETWVREVVETACSSYAPSPDKPVGEVYFPVFTISFDMRTGSAGIASGMYAEKGSNRR